MFKKNIQAIISAALIIFGLVLGMKVSSGLILGDYLLKAVGLPTMTNGDAGFHITGLFTIVFLILGIVLFRQYFRQYNTLQRKRIFIGLIVFVILYQPIYNTASKAIKSQYNGLQAIEYNKTESTCFYNITPESDYIECRCSLKFINYSHMVQEFQIKPERLEENIKENLRKYSKIDGIDLEYVDGKNFISLPPLPSGMFSNPATNPINLEFRFKKKGISEDVNGGGGAASPSITIFNEIEVRKFD